MATAIKLRNADTFFSLSFHNFIMFPFPFDQEKLVIGENQMCQYVSKSTFATA